MSYMKDIYFQVMEEIDNGTQSESLKHWRAQLDEDDGYREWSETIEKQNQEQQDTVMVEYDLWEDFQKDLEDPGSRLLKLLTKAGLPPF